jgi:peptidoglycan/LPS O-acetylase OafA/YrhL
MDSDCVGWAWYLANDMQFFLIAPLLTIALFKRPKVGYLAISLLWIGSVIYCLSLSLKYHFSALAISSMKDGGDPHSFVSLIYMKPWARVQPYLVGVLAAYAHFKYGAKIASHKLVALLSLVLASGLLYGCVYVIHSEQAGDQWSNAGNAFYIALSRTFWGLGLAVVVLVCCNGGGSIVNDFLSASFWTPMSRIGLSAYLIHYMILLWAVSSAQTTMFFSDNSIVTSFLGLSAMTYGFGFLVGAFIESPMRNIGKILFK